MNIDRDDVKIINSLLFITLPLIILFFYIIIRVVTFNRLEVEKECVSFYKENNYVLNSCEKYKDKLLENE